LIIKSIALVEQTQNKTETGEVGWLYSELRFCWRLSPSEMWHKVSRRFGGTCRLHPTSAVRTSNPTVLLFRSLFKGSFSASLIT
jgi:hypothetical protein